MVNHPDGDAGDLVQCWRYFYLYYDGGGTSRRDDYVAETGVDTGSLASVALSTATPSAGNGTLELVSGDQLRRFIPTLRVTLARLRRSVPKRFMQDGTGGSNVDWGHDLGHCWQPVFGDWGCHG